MKYSPVTGAVQFLTARNYLRHSAGTYFHCTELLFVPHVHEMRPPGVSDGVNTIDTAVPIDADEPEIAIIPPGVTEPPVTRPPVATVRP